MPPARLAEAARSGRYLSLLERQRIATLRAQGLSMRAIADRLGRAPSTVSRELRRNVRPHDRGVYDGDLAHARARQRAHRPRTSRVLADAELRQLVQGRLEQEWSPQQIAAWLRLVHPTRADWHVCHETIYQALYRGDRGLSRRLTRHLRTGRPLRKRRRRADQRRCRFIAPALLIEHRPPVVEDRIRIGDWERDLIVGRQNRSAIATLVDRTSRFLRLVHLPGERTAENVRDALLAVLSELPAQVRLSLTWDQGSEMACHDQIAPLLRDGVFFAHPGRPWQRGSNENTNGLLRQYFPKRTDLSVHTAADLRAVEQRLNHRPRKVLGWRTPTEVFIAAMTP
ncbi:IS30 family transposase [Actinoplanes sp. NEAU-A11]|uniref:IS30 family transposase n=1 Tax=Actinoplanes aureus TaxID=2792083 RepID=A0A931G018_9ACTN|nr:IS30 family transposase [Actinoplanes aureus]MBG0565380.1 IS30 family transposase [Actinoplanes aureus]